ncbi:hypothetical protein Tco_1565681, partial [Tanacetum coccineum]
IRTLQHHRQESGDRLTEFGERVRALERQDVPPDTGSIDTNAPPATACTKISSTANHLILKELNGLWCTNMVELLYKECWARCCIWDAMEDFAEDDD